MRNIASQLEDANQALCDRKLLHRLLSLMAFGLMITAATVEARVDALKIRERIDIPATATYPAYERLSGTIQFRNNPALAVNRRIADLSLARTTHPHGWTTSSANFMILRPKNPPPEPLAVIEISNRGGKALLRYFQQGGRTIDPREPGDFGDGLLMRRGWTLVWVGWQWDVPPVNEQQLRLEAPIAPSRDPANYGLVRADWVVDERAEVLPLSHRNHVAYRPARSVDPRNVLTRRTTRLGPREVVNRSQWKFVTRRDPNGVRAPHIETEGGFNPGYIYELSYVAKDPRVAGLGLAAIRDVASYLKHDAAAELRVNHVLGFGVSQTGRFARHFLYQGFNEDESGRRAFDGLLIHSAGAGRGSFNHRFAQPSRDGHRYSAFFYPTDLFPFSGRSQQDPVTGREDGLLASYERPELAPRIMYTNTGYEYWGRSAALLHVNVSGDQDVALLPNERLYHLASGQHYVDRWPAEEPVRPGVWRGNPLDFLVNLRALLVSLGDWVTEDREPPASRYPRLEDGTLTPLSDFALPTIAGLTAPSVAQEAYRANYGRRWAQGIVDRQPPELGPAFPTLVPATDEYGNEVGGIRNLEVQVPAATYTPWSLRDGRPNPNELMDFRGYLVPLHSCHLAGDERPPLPAEDPMPAITDAARSLVEAGYVLTEDQDRIIQRNLALHRWARSLACGESETAVANR